MENVYKNWKETGYAWEQYDSITGKGQRTAHFLGWTSLVVNMMSMPETVSVSVPVAEKVVEEAKPVVEAAEEKVETVVEKVAEVVKEVLVDLVSEPDTEQVFKDEL